MSKAIRFFPLICTFALDIIINLIVFILTPEEIVATANFWLSWSFAFPVSIIILCALYGFTFGRSGKSTRLISYQAFTVPYVALDLAFLAIFFIAAYALRDNLLILTVIAETVVTAIGGYVLIKPLFAISVLRDVNSIQQKTVERKKLTYIPELTSMLDSAVASAKDEGVKNLLLNLAYKVRTSEPMSPPEVETMENELRAMVYQIVQFVNMGNTQNLEFLVNQAIGKLAERNNKCALYKAM